MDLLTLNLKKIEEAFGDPQNLINQLQRRNAKLSGCDKRIMTSLIIMLNNFVDLDISVEMEVCEHRDIAPFVIERLKHMCEVRHCVHIDFMIKLIEFNLEHTSNVRQLA